ncbi:VPLPA-CTERM sorting domain-containing protein [Sulfitobacter sp. LCG007]
MKSMRFPMMVATLAISAGGWGGTALAQCAPSNPGEGDTVTCTGLDTVGVDDGSKSVTVDVLSGATVDTTVSGDDAIKLKDLGASVNNAGTIAGGDEAIVGGNGLSVDNAGDITAGDHAIVGETEGDDYPSEDVTITNRPGASIAAGGDGVKAGDRLTLINYGTMTAGDDLVQAEEADGSGADDVEIQNHGTMVADDKGITVDDGTGFRLVNTGRIESKGNEAVEAGSDAEVFNDSGAEILGFDDAVQLGENGYILNEGTIENTQTLQDLIDDPDLEAQDAIDIDSGTIVNTASGIIRSTVNAAIDYDSSGVEVSRIVNGGLISGTIAVETDPSNTKSQQIENRGSMVGTSGLALNLGGGDDAYTQFAGGSLLGGADFGEGMDIMTLDGLFTGTIGGNGALFDGGTGTDTFSLTSYALAQITGSYSAGIFDLGVDDGLGGSFSILLTGWEQFRFSGASYTEEDLMAALGQPAPVPLPASALLLAGALAGLGGLRRRS